MWVQGVQEVLHLQLHLIRHLRVHMGEPYVCGQCGKATARAQASSCSRVCTQARSCTLAPSVAGPSAQALPPFTSAEPHGLEALKCQCGKAFTCSCPLLGPRQSHSQHRKAFGWNSHLIFQQTTQARKKRQLASLMSPVLMGSKSQGPETLRDPAKNAEPLSSALLCATCCQPNKTRVDSCEGLMCP